MTIQRYEMHGQYDQWDMEPDAEGKYVLFSDHEAAVAAARAEIAELKRQLGGGCEANHGNEHTTIRQGTYAYCAKCGKTLRGVRFCHLPRAAAEAPQ